MRFVRKLMNRRRLRRFAAIDKVLCRAYELGLIDTVVLHELDAAFKYGHGLRRLSELEDEPTELPEERK